LNQLLQELDKQQLDKQLQYSNALQDQLTHVALQTVTQVTETQDAHSQRLSVQPDLPQLLNVQLDQLQLQQDLHRQLCSLALKDQLIHVAHQIATQEIATQDAHSLQLSGQHYHQGELKRQDKQQQLSSVL
jgi:hypothetical protein